MGYQTAPILAALAHPVFCISSCHILKAQDFCLSANGYLSLISASDLPPPPQSPPTRPPPIDSIHDITGTEKLSKNLVESSLK